MVELVVVLREVDGAVPDGHRDLVEERALAGTVGALSRGCIEERAVFLTDDLVVANRGTRPFVEPDVRPVWQ